jgi:archaellum biogenesis ATPase FlaH
VSHRITFDALQRRITIVATPPAKQKEALDCLHKIRAHPEFRADYAIVVNLLEAGLHGYPSVADAAEFNEAIKRLFPGQKVALLSLHPRTMHSGFMAVTVSSEPSC